jgi:hypothetical protein
MLNASMEILQKLQIICGNGDFEVEEQGEE